MISKEEAQAYEDKRRKLKAALKPTFPTIVSVLETGEERSRLDRAENARKQAEAFQRRVQKGSKPPCQKRTGGSPKRNQHRYKDRSRST